MIPLQVSPSGLHGVYVVLVPPVVREQRLSYVCVNEDNIKDRENKAIAKNTMDDSRVTPQRHNLPFLFRP